MIAAKSYFIFNKHNLATLGIMNIPSLYRSPRLISSFGCLFKMPILAEPYPFSDFNMSRTKFDLI